MKKIIGTIILSALTLAAAPSFSETVGKIKTYAIDGEFWGTAYDIGVVFVDADIDTAAGECAATSWTFDKSTAAGIAKMNQYLSLIIAAKASSENLIVQFTADAQGDDDCAAAEFISVGEAI